jgi:bacteriorhodopsin
MDKSPSMNRTLRGRTWLWIGVGAVVLVALVVLLITQSGGGSGGGIY